MNEGFKTLKDLIEFIEQEYKGDERMIFLLTITAKAAYKIAMNKLDEI